MSDFINPDDIAKKNAGDAPELRGSRDQACSNCVYFSRLPEYYSDDAKGLCKEHDFITSLSWLCDDYGKVIYGSEAALKSGGMSYAVKAVGDWEIEIMAVPFAGKDSDGQWFDPETDTMQGSFPAPALFYHHGVKPGSQELQEKPIVIGKSLSIKKTLKGWVIRGLLDKTSEYAKLVWEAVKKGAVAVSSDSIAHLARLDVGGKIIQYEKNRAGRISVWPLAGVSLWDLTAGNFKPASTQAFALPVMKAIYKDAGMVFPDLDTTGALETEETVKRRAEVLERSERILSKSKRRKI